MTSCSHPSPIKTREPYLCVKHLRCEKTPWPGRVFSGRFYVQSSCCGINTHTYTYSESERAKWNNAKEEPQSPYITGNGRVLQVTSAVRYDCLTLKAILPPTLSPQLSVTHLACCSKMLFVVLLCGRAIWIFLETMQIEIGYQKVHLREEHRSGG